MWRCGERIAELNMGGANSDAYRHGYSHGYYGYEPDPGKFAGRGRKKYKLGYDEGKADRPKAETSIPENGKL